MKINMAVWDRIARIFFGGVLLAWAVAGGPWWAYFGLALLATAAWNFDPIYALLRISTVRISRARTKAEAQASKPSVPR